MIPFLNSLLIASGTVIYSLILGLPLAILLVKTDLPFKKWIKYIYLVPIFIPPSVIALSWMSLGASVKWLYSLNGAVVLLTLCYFPFVTLLSFGGLSGVGGDLEEAARIDYGELGILRRVTLPYAFNHILAGALFVFVFAISNYEIPALLGVNTFPGEIFIQFSGYYNLQKAFLLSLPLVVLTSTLIIIAARVLRDRDYVAIGQTWIRPRIIKLSSKTKAVAVTFTAALLGVSVILPFSVLAYRAGKLTVYLKAFKLSWRELNFTLFWAILGAFFIVVLSFFIAYLIERSKTKLRRVLYYASILPFAVPATVLGIVLIKIFNYPALNFIYSTPLILILGYFLHFSPFAIRVLSASIKHINRDMEEEAEMCGAGFWRKLFLVVAPLCRPGLVISLAIVFALIIGELGMTILVVPAGASTLVLKIYTLMHYGAGKLVAALALILTLIILVLMGVLLFFNKSVKKVFLAVMIFLIIFSTTYSKSFAQEEKAHLYSTWNILEVDTSASAWLIKRFIDKEAEFRFYVKGEFIEKGIAFDTPDAEFRRTQNMSTFETLMKKYQIEDTALIKIGQMIHEIEVNYWQESRDEQTQKLKQKIRQIIDTAENPLDCFEQTFSFLDRIYAEFR